MLYEQRWLIFDPLLSAENTAIPLNQRMSHGPQQMPVTVPNPRYTVSFLGRRICNEVKLTSETLKGIYKAY